MVPFRGYASAKLTFRLIARDHVKLRLWFVGCAFALLLSASLDGANETAIASRAATVDSVKLHYLTAGHGPTVILLHGYTQTSRMWKPIIPLLANKFTVIAPDLPGIGESEIPASGLDMKTSAIRIHARQIVRRRKSERSRSRHRSHGRLRLRRPIPR